MVRQTRCFRIVASTLATLLAAGAMAAPSEGVIDIAVYRSDRPFSTSLPIDNLYWGMLRSLQTQALNWFIPAFLLFAIAMLCARLCKPPLNQRAWTFISLGGIFVFSAILSLKEVQGWDELFIGAKHAHSMLVANKFSYNLSNMQEANSEFLPLFVTGMLAKLGFPIIETLLALGLAGNLWLIITTYKVFSKITSSSAAGFIYAAAVGLFPCVLASSMSGFFSCLFSAAILSSVYLLFFSDHQNARRNGLVLLAFLTLFRIEGVLVAFLMWLVLFVFAKAKSFAISDERWTAVKQALTTGVLLVAPFTVASLLRFIAFGHMIPAPAALKMAGGDPKFAAAGVEYMVSVLDSFDLREVAILAVPAVIAALLKDGWIRKLAVAWLVLIAFSIPYIPGGGDWFPAYWARYFMPAIFITYFFFWGAWSSVAARFGSKIRYAQPALAILLVASPYALERSFFVDSNGWPSAFTVTRRMIGEPGYSWLWGRVNALGVYGEFLKQTTAPNVRIGSPEEATIMWYADRDAVDLLGFSSPEISYSKVDPMEAEDLRHDWILLHRKRNPAVLLIYKPEIVALMGVAYNETNTDGFPNDQAILDHYVDVYQTIGKAQLDMDIAYYRVGSFEYLKKLGYHLIFVGTPRAIYLYWVNDSILKDHIAAIKRLGCREVGRVSLPYHISPSVADHFSSGEELLGTR